jgi:hypothetical protein
VRAAAARVALAVLFAGAAFPGLWALLSPRSFFDDFPGGGRHWVAGDGPFNEHLVRDVGALQLALAVVTLAALLSLARLLVLTAGWAWLVWGVPHLAHHFRHRDAIASGDRAVVLGTFVVQIVLAALLVVRPVREEPTAVEVP